MVSVACSTAAGEPADSTPCRPWKLVPSPAFGSGGTLFGVSGTSSSDVWAVGQSGSGEPILEHWDGTAWTSVPQPVPVGALGDVAAISPDDAWAVGNDNNVAVVEHWDGTQWERVPVQLPSDAGLNALAALSSNDVWAAGEYRANNGTLQPLFVHWDGTSWSPVRQGAGTKRSGGKMFDLAALSPTDIWAVGYKGTPSIDEFEPLAEHWDGTAWQVIDVPVPQPPGNNILDGVSGVAADDVWAAGSTEDGGVVQHWDGNAWNVELLENEGPVSGVGAAGADDIWVVGTVSQPRPLILHWDGQAWKRAPARAGVGTSLRDVEVISPNDVWTVGNYFPVDFTELDPVTLHYSGPCGSSGE
jgi:hypothetical protein